MSHDFDSANWPESRRLISHKFDEGDKKFDEMIKLMDALQKEMRAMSDERLVFKGKAAVVIALGGAVAGFIGGHIADFFKLIFHSI